MVTTVVVAGAAVPIGCLTLDLLEPDAAEPAQHATQIQIGMPTHNARKKVTPPAMPAAIPKKCLGEV